MVNNLRVRKRNGDIVNFDSERIYKAISSAFNTVIIDDYDTIAKYITVSVLEKIYDLNVDIVDIETIQNLVEVTLSENKYYDVAKNYILYRSEHETLRKKLHYNLEDGTELPHKQLIMDLIAFTKNIKGTDYKDIVNEISMQLYDGITIKELQNIILLVIRSFMVLKPEYDIVASRAHLTFTKRDIYKTLGLSDNPDIEDYISKYLDIVLEDNLLDKNIVYKYKDNIDKLSDIYNESKDDLLSYLSAKTLTDRYLIRSRSKKIIETPQMMFLRVAMGLFYKEDMYMEYVEQFYKKLSSLEYMTSTPTLFNSSTIRQQLSSCYLTTVEDSLDGIFDALKEDARLSKYAGGIANDWTPVRALGSNIKGTNGESQGVIPFLKLVNDTAVAVNQCFHPNTYLDTEDGIKTISEITPGTYVRSFDGVYEKVNDVLKYSNKDKLLAIYTKHGVSPLIVSMGHPIMVYNTNTEILEWVEVKDIKSYHKLVYRRPEPSTKIIKTMKPEMMLLLGYVYGYIASDGIVNIDGDKVYFILNNTLGNNVDILKNFIIKSNLTTATVTENDYEFDTMVFYLPISIVNNIAYIKDNKLIPFIKLQYNKYGKHLLSRFLEGIRINSTIDSIALNITLKEMYKIRNMELISGVSLDSLSTSYNYNTLIIPNTVKYDENEHCYDEIIAMYSYNDNVNTIYDLKIDNIPVYTANNLVVHNGGKRRGSICSYLELWHADILDFIDLKKNTGDERRRTYDMNTAVWIPDYFMEVLKENGTWYLFSPNETPDLHEAVGYRFKTLYQQYVELGRSGKLCIFKEIPAFELWKRIITSLYETGHPWITFKDISNIRYSNQHIGTVKSSNLCTEILIHTSDKETAVCNLGSIVLTRHLLPGVDNLLLDKPDLPDIEKILDIDKLKDTINIAVRGLDNVIDINFYPSKKAEYSNLNNRPIGLGIMGFQDVLQILGIPYESNLAIKLADMIQELVSYYAIDASIEIAKEKGVYSTYNGSLWSKNILPIDTLSMVDDERTTNIEVNRDYSLDWNPIRSKLKKYGIRNSLVMAIAPTATIANICNVSPSIEPTYQNLYVKSNLSGEFVVYNRILIDKLKHLGIWSESIAKKLLSTEGSLQTIDIIPDNIKAIFKTAFEIDQKYLIDCAAVRQKWIDQSQSLNLYVRQPTGKYLSDLYIYAYNKGLKTTYYLRSIAATKVTSEIETDDAEPKYCSIDNPDCEVCQ